MAEYLREMKKIGKLNTEKEFQNYLMEMLRFAKNFERKDMGVQSGQMPKTIEGRETMRAAAKRIIVTNNTKGTFSKDMVDAIDDFMMEAKEHMPKMASNVNPHLEMIVVAIDDVLQGKSAFIKLGVNVKRSAGAVPPAPTEYGRPPPPKKEMTAAAPAPASNARPPPCSPSNLAGCTPGQKTYLFDKMKREAAASNATKAALRRALATARAKPCPKCPHRRVVEIDGVEYLTEEGGDSVEVTDVKDIKDVTDVPDTAIVVKEEEEDDIKSRIMAFVNGETQGIPHKYVIAVVILVLLFIATQD